MSTQKRTTPGSASQINSDETVVRYLIGETGQPEKIHVHLAGGKAFHRTYGARSRIEMYEEAALGRTAKEALALSGKVFRAWIVTDSWHSEGEVKPVYLRLCRGRVRVWHEDGHEDRCGLTFNGRARVFVREVDAVECALAARTERFEKAKQESALATSRLREMTKRHKALARRKQPLVTKTDVHAWVVDKTETAKQAAKSAAKEPA